MSQTDALRLASQALLLLGEKPIDTFDGEALPNVTARHLYAPIRDQILGCHPWWFTRRFDRLARLAGTPSEATGFSAAYQLPPDCLRIACVYTDGRPVRSWQVGRQTIWLDAGPNERVDLEYHSTADEAEMPPAVELAVVYALATAFAVPVREDLQAERTMAVKADQHLRLAKHANAVSQPQRGLPLTRFQGLMAR
jgi:hypothetical protein